MDSLLDRWAYARVQQRACQWSYAQRKQWIQELLSADLSAPAADAGERLDLDRQEGRLGLLQRLVDLGRELAEDSNEAVPFPDVADKLAEVSKAINANAELLDEVQRWIDPPASAKPWWLQRLVDEAKADVINADLQHRDYPQDDQRPGWRIYYTWATGKVIAEPEEPASPDQPAKLWGSAPTATAARDLVATRHPVAPPVQIVSPQPEREALGHWWETSPPEPDLSELLSERGPCYDALVRACRHTRAQLRRSVAPEEDEQQRYTQLDELLQQRATDLETVRPHVAPVGDVHDPGSNFHRFTLGHVRSAQWVRTDLVIGSEGSSRWGEFGGHREESLTGIADGLLCSSDNIAAFINELYTPRHPVCLICLPGWAGPIYIRGMNGSHRIHAAHLLDLPYIAAEVSYYQLPTQLRLFGLPLEQKVARDEGCSLLAGLCRRGVIDGELVETDTLLAERLRCRYLPAPWLLQPPEKATEFNTLYEQIYPGALARLGIPAEVGTDPQQWRRWLLEAADTTEPSTVHAGPAEA